MRISQSCFRYGWVLIVVLFASSSALGAIKLLTSAGEDYEWSGATCAIVGRTLKITLDKSRAVGDPASVEIILDPSDSLNVIFHDRIDQVWGIDRERQPDSKCTLSLKQTSTPVRLTATLYCEYMTILGVGAYQAIEIPQNAPIVCDATKAASGLAR